MSALVFGGLPRAVLELVEAGQCELFYSAPIHAEVRRVLEEKFAWAPSMLKEVLPVLWSMGKLVEPQTEINAILDDPDDNRILECAVEAQADFIVSGDHHLLTLHRFKSTSIVSPRQFIETYLAESS